MDELTVFEMTLGAALLAIVHDGFLPPAERIAMLSGLYREIQEPSST